MGNPDIFVGPVGAGTVPDPGECQDATANGSHRSAPCLANEGRPVTEPVVAYNPEIYATVTEYSRHCGVHAKTVLSWIYYKKLPAVRCEPQPGRKFQWLIPREQLDAPVLSKVTPVAIQAEHEGRMVEWILIAEAARRRDCTASKIAKCVQKGILPSIERRSLEADNRQRIYVLASAVPGLPLLFPRGQQTAKPSTRPSRSGKHVQLRAYDQTTPRPVRTADGWRIEAYTSVGRRRSSETFASYAKAQAAIDAGYEMPSLAPPPTWPRVHKITRYAQIDGRLCALCAAQEAVMDAAFSAYIETEPNQRHRIVICDPKAHDILTEYQRSGMTSKTLAQFTLRVKSKQGLY